jgi:uncharacterized protein
MRCLLPLILLVAPLTATGHEPQFDTRDAMIAMRDGVKLHTRIFTPQGAHGPLPFLITRTPYGAAGNPASSFSGAAKELFDEGYIFVSQDIRGRHRSEGQFVMMRPPRDRRDPRAVDESTDAYDTIEWLLHNVHGNNGRAGMYGISYPGWLTVMAMLDPHPALRAASPQASPADMWMGDDFHHQGSFRLSYGFEYAALLETSKDSNSNFKFDIADLFEWYLKLGPLGNVNRTFFHSALPTWNDFVAHPDYDSFWQRQAFVNYIGAVKVPALNVAGWWDQEDFYGPMKVYEALEKFDRDHRNYLVVGPWNHGQWGGGTGRSLGKIDFGSDTGSWFREHIQAPWFAYWLKDKGTLDLAEATVFESGSNEWKRYRAWPPQEGVEKRSLYLREGGRLSFAAPESGAAAADSADTFLSDPLHPVPYRQRPIGPTYGGLPGWAAWQVEDQRFVYLRPDVAAWATEPLAADIVMPGAIAAQLYCSTTGTDADWVVKLIDVYPEADQSEALLNGYQLMIAADVLRGRYRNSFEKPEAIAPGEVAAYRVDLLSRNHRFRRGHRIMVQVQSTWFPLIDRNPQRYVPNIFAAAEADFRAAEHRVWRTRQWPSQVDVTVLR